MNPLETVKSFYTILGSENGLAALDLDAPSVRWTEMFPGYAGTWTGPDAVRRNVFEPFDRDWDDFHVTTESFVVDNPLSLPLGHIRMSPKGPANLWLPPLYTDGRCEMVPFFRTAVLLRI